MKNESFTPDRGITESQVLALLQDFDDDPSTFDARMEVWAQICEMDQRRGPLNFTEIERATFERIATELQSSDQTALGSRMSQMLNHFEHPTFLVGSSGKVTVQNDAALKGFHLSVGDSLTDLPFEFDADVPLSGAIAESLSQSKNDSQTLLLRAYGPCGNIKATLAITPAAVNPDGTKQALVFIIHSKLAITAPNIIKEQYDLTKAEAALLSHFLQGQSMEDIAADRGRSLATVRTQLYTLMSKMSVQSQTELLRVSMSLHQFTDQVDDIAKQLRHPHRKRLDLVRPGGRSVQVTLAGDLGGRPLVFMPSCLTHTFPPKTEGTFHRAGICAISMCRPGFGDTDPPLNGEDDIQTFANDLRVLLDQMGHDNCVLLASNTTSPLMFKVAAHLADKVSFVVQNSGCIPAPYLKKKKSSSSWANGAIQAPKQQPKLKAFMVRSAVRAWRTFGQQWFLKMQFSKHPKELEQALQPDLFDEIQGALEMATQQGHHWATKDLLDAFDDFSSDIADCPVPILVIHSDQNHIYPIEAVRDLVSDFCDQMTLVEVKGTGFTLVTSYVDLILKQIDAFKPTH